MKRRKKQDKGESEIVRLTNRLEDLVSDLRLLGVLGDPPTHTALEPPEPRFAPRPVFAIGISQLPDQDCKYEGGCFTLTVETGKEIHTYATFGRVSWIPPAQVQPAPLTFTTTTCPLVQHLCGGQHSYCPLRVDGKYELARWYVRLLGYTIPLN